MTKLVNRAKVTTATTGTGTITLGSAVEGFQTFSNAGLVNGDLVRYTIEENGAWEIGTGTFSSNTLTRTPSESSNGGAAINLTGNAVVYVTATADDINNVETATKLATARTISLSGDVTGSVSFDGSSNATITATVVDDSHNHIIANVDGLQTALDGKSATTHNHTLDSLSNTTITSNTAGEILKWNGTAWVNNTLAEAGIQPAGSYLTGNQTITLSGDVSGSGTTSIVVTVADDSHNHIISNVDGLQAALDGKLSTTGKAADSELLDGLNSSDFARYSAGGTLTNALADAAWVANYGGTTNVDHIWHDDAANAWNFNSDSSFKGAANSRVNAGSFYANGSVVWNAGNDGAGSGLDADLLDGNHASSFSTLSGSNSFSGLNRFSNLRFADNISNDYNDFDELTAILHRKESATAFRPVSNIQYWNGSSWVATTALNSIIPTLLTGDSQNEGNIPNAYKRFRFTIQLSSSYLGGFWIVSERHWSGSGDIGRTYDMKIEHGNSDMSVIEATASFTVGANVYGFNKLLYWHYPNQYMRVEYDFSNYVGDIPLVRFDAYNVYGRGTGGLSGDTPFNWNSTTLNTPIPTLRLNGNTVWHQGNDGSGSGLDADLWDGQQFSSYLNQAVLTSSSPTFSNAYIADNVIHSGDTDTYMGFHAADQWRVVTGGTERFEVNNSDVTVQSALKEKYVALSGTTPNIDVDVGGAFSLTTSGNTTFTFAAFTSGISGGFILELTSGGAHTITWPASVDWAGGTAPDAPASGETDIYVFWSRNGGTTWYGVHSVDAAA